MGCNQIKGFEFFRDFFTELGSIAADFEFSTIAFVFAFSVVENVDAKFSRHVQTIVRTDVDTHLTCCTGLPNDTDSSVVVSGNEEPWLHVFETFVWILNGLWLPETWEEVRSDSIRGEFLLGDVVVLGTTFCSMFASIIKELWVRGVVISHAQFLREHTTQEGEGS